MKTENNAKVSAYSELEQGIYSALETYSNVHRGNGFKSLATTHLFEQARNIVLEYLQLNKRKYLVIFCTPISASYLTNQIDSESYKLVSSKELGLSLGVIAIAVKRKEIPKGIPELSGGGTTRLISKEWIVWANPPEKFEAGTPAIINVIAFAKALLLVRKYGMDIFKQDTPATASISEILGNHEFGEYSGQELLDKLKQSIIGHNTMVPTIEGSKNYINLDNSASTPTFTPIWDTFSQTYKQSTQIQQEVVHKVRSITSGFLNAPLTDYDIIFTSNTTEAINLAAKSLSIETSEEESPVILNTLLEHSSNDLPWRMVPNSSVIRLSIDSEGFADLKEIERILIEYNKSQQHRNKRIKLLAISGASNVLGVCNNLAEIAKTAHKYGAKILVDAAQLVAHKSVNILDYEIDYFAFSAHKIYAPFGCGVLIARKEALKFNESELRNIQAYGEENASGIAALGKALKLIQEIGMELIAKEEQIHTKKALKELSKIPVLKIHGISSPDNPKIDQKLGVILFEIKGMMANKVSENLSLQRGIGIRSGCFCAHIIIKHLLHISPGLEKFQKFIVSVFPKLSLPGLARVSFGIENSTEDIDNLVLALKNITSKNGKPEIPKSEVKKQVKAFVRETAKKVYS